LSGEAATVKDCGGGQSAILDIGIPEEHHGLTYHAGDPVKIAKVVKIDTYMAGQFAYYLDKMKSVREGGRTILPSTIAKTACRCWPGAAAARPIRAAMSNMPKARRSPTCGCH
jgi:hypothetical protein